jgi:predicted TIM-barrel fold metal-dependent hydrolase
MGVAARKLAPKDKYQAIADAYRTPNKKLGKEYFVFDGDRHVIEPLDALTKYLDKEWKKYAPKIVIDEHGGTRLLIEGRLYQKPQGWGMGRPEGNADYRPRGKSMTNAEAVEHAQEKKDEDMDITGVDVGLWIPTAGLFLPDIIDKNKQYGFVRAYNDWMAKDWATSKRHLWCATIPIVPKMAVEEIKRCKKMGANAVWMRPNVMQEVRWWGPDWDEVWDTMAKFNLPLVFHEATGTYNATYSTDYKFDVYWMAHVASHPLEMATAVIGIIGYGVLERHPGLKAMMCEAGVTWVPYILGRMDEHAESRYPGEVNLKLLPSEYFKRQMAICAFEDDEPLLRETMEWFGGCNLGYTSDYPHWDSSGVSGVKRYLDNYPDFDEKTRNMFFSHNLIDLFEWDV